MPLSRARALLRVALVLGVAIAGCSYDDVGGPVGERMEISPTRDTIVAGNTITPDDTVRLRVTVFNDQGIEVPNPAVTWSSSADTVATVDQSGLVTATGYGQARITARSGDMEVVAIIDVVLVGSTTDIDSVFTQISAGADFTCATTSLGRGYCWGIDSVFQLGAVQADTVCIDDFQPIPNDRKGYACSLLPLRVQTDRRLELAAAGWMHACARADNGDAFCWGASDSGQVGSGTDARTPRPVLVTSALQFTTLTAGAIHTCGLVEGGAAYCWGGDGAGRLGNGIFNASSTTPIPVIGGISFRTIAAGLFNTCGIDNNGLAYCWGDNHAGQLGTGTIGDSAATPLLVAGGLTFSTISVGGRTTCGIVSSTAGGSGPAYCWGAGGVGQLGSNTRDSSVVPRPVAGPQFKSIAVGTTHVCAITDPGDLYCWGTYDLGILITDPFITDPLRRNDIYDTPTRVGNVAFTSITSGRRHSCGVTSAGAAYCWGSNVLGPFGDGFQALFNREPQRVRTPL